MRQACPCTSGWDTSTNRKKTIAPARVPRRWTVLQPGRPSDVADAWRGALYGREGDIDSTRGDVSLRVETRGGVVTVRLTPGDVYQQEMRAPFHNPRGVSFVVRPQGSPTLLERLTGGQVDLEVGDPNFDAAFQVITPTPMQTQELLEDSQVRRLFRALPDIEVRVRAGSSLIDYPAGLDELYVRCDPMLDTWEVKALVDLAEALLVQLDVLGNLTGSVRAHIRRLVGPRGSVRGRATVWEGDVRRRAAADALGEEGDSRAVRPLMRVLNDPDSILRANAIRALAKIRDRRAIPSLVRFLGTLTEGATRPLAEEAAQGLREFGMSDLVDAFQAALEGDAEPLRGQTAYAEEVSAALVDALEGPDRALHGNVMRTLADLGAVAAIPALERRLESITIPQLEAECREALQTLRALSTLPRPAAPTHGIDERLPRPADPRD